MRSGPSYPLLGAPFDCLNVCPASAFMRPVADHPNGPLQAPKVIGSTGKILKSGPNDRVFVYFADHGAPGRLSTLERRAGHQHQSPH